MSDLDSSLVLAAYAEGWFPMAVGEGEIRWFSPDPRGILPIDRFHVSHSLERVVRSGRFRIEVDRAFDEVIAASGERKETWIDDRIRRVYGELHRLGWAHSVEAWCGDRLAGGLYGVAIGGAFFGESMFHREKDASKVALHALVARLRARGFGLLDIQWTTPHLQRFGAEAIPRAEYLRRLRRALRLAVAW